MRNTFLILLIGALQAYPNESLSQNTKLSLNLANVPVNEVLEAIENNSEFYFLYNAKLVDVNRNVTILANNEKVSDILNSLFQSSGVNYKVFDKQIILTPGELTELPEKSEQQATVNGRIYDASTGEPMAGVNIQIKGTSIGAITDIDGKFSINTLDPDAAIIVTFIGYVSQEIQLAGRRTLDVNLTQSMEALEEVVVVGYGTQKKVNLTGAVDVISNEKLADRQAPTVSQLLQGLTPGANFSVVGRDGFQPGATMDITIRGIGSLNGGSPYVLIDGIPGDLNVLNPNDIESVSVLKDAASSAIYGARAAFGVILITTKRGNKQEKLSVTYSGNVFLKTPGELPESVDSYTWARLINDAGFNRGGTNYPAASLERIKAYQNQDWDWLRQNIPNWPEGATVFGAYPNGNLWDNANLNYANTDWWDVLYGQSFNQNHNISVRGGSNSASYYFSAGQLEENGVLNYGTDLFKRINLMAKVDLSIAPWWDFSWESRFSRRNRERPNNLRNGYDNMFNEIARSYPITPIYDGWGNYLYESHIPYFESGGDKNIENDSWNKFKMELRPVKGWKINADFGYNSYSGVNTSIQELIYVHHVDNSRYVNGVSIPNSLDRTHRNGEYWETNIYTSYNLNLNNSHNFFILLGSQFEYGKNSQMRGNKTDLLVEDVPSFETATGPVLIFESLTHRSTQGYFSRFNYNYKEKYLFETNVRYDGSYVFRAGNRWGLFPSFSAGWNVNKEVFWENIKGYINTLKIRGSWGQLGNQNVSPYSDLELIPMQAGKLNWILKYGESRPIGYTSTPSIVNRNLTWETTTTKNLGLNATFLKNRLTLDFDMFQRITTDMVGPSQAKPGVLGANVPRDNNSTLRTTGWELALNWKQDLKKGFSYFINLNLYDYKSVVTQFFNPTGTLSTWYEGSEVGELWGYKVNDLYRTQEDLDAHREVVDLSFISTTWRTGDVKYEDTNNDNKVNNGTNTLADHGDLSIIGNTEPHYQYGLTAGFSFKGFDFSMLWKGVAKKDIYFTRGANLFWGFGDARHNGALSTSHLDYFRDAPGTVVSGLYEGDANLNLNAYYPRPYLNSSENRKNKDYPNTRYLQDASYLRLQNIQIGYSLPQRLISKLSLAKLHIFFSGENLLTLSKMLPGIDPIALVGTGGVVGKLTYPADRIYSFGLSITY